MVQFVSKSKKKEIFKPRSFVHEVKNREISRDLNFFSESRNLIRKYQHGSNNK